LGKSKLFFEEKSIKLSVTPIFRKISYLKPLPTTVAEIQKLKANPNSGIKELTTVITKDPIVSAKVLKFANSPAYGLRSEVFYHFLKV
jgi:HD-like signal output (HDOD) protein